MNVEIKNSMYWVDLENNKVYTKVNNEIKGQLTIQDKIDFVIDVAKRIQKIRRVYKSKKVKQNF